MSGQALLAEAFLPSRPLIYRDRLADSLAAEIVFGIVLMSAKLVETVFGKLQR